MFLRVSCIGMLSIRIRGGGVESLGLLSMMS